MTKHGKTIKIFLIDGEANGRMTCELSNWTGKAYKINRAKIKDCKDREELQKTGVYLLLGKDIEGNDMVYIGEAEQVFKRLNQHLATKDFWNEVIVFISKDENLNKAHIKYLEHRLHYIVEDANRYIIENTLIPSKPAIAESDYAEMEVFIENAKLLVSTLGHKLFEPKREIAIQNDKKLFYIQGTRGANAIGEPHTDGFLVLKGSQATINTVPSLTPSFLRLRDKLIQQRILEEQKDSFVFLDDYVFSSPSLAAATVMGRNANGLTEWKMKDGSNLKEFETSDSKINL